MEVWLSMFRQILILSAIVFLIAILSIHAEVTFIPDAEIALPDSFFIDDNTTFEFKDLNNDYVEEIIIENESIIASYSLKENRTIDYFIKPVDTILHEYTWGYINDDSLLDFVKIFFPAEPGVYICPHSHPDFHRPKALAQIYLGGYEFTPADTITLAVLPEAVTGIKIYSIQKIKRLFWDDTDSDGIPEIYFQLQILSQRAFLGMLGWDELLFYNYKYIVWNDSAQQINKLPEHGLLKYPLYDDSVNAFISINDSASFYYMHTHAFRYNDFEWTNVRIIQKDSLYSTFNIPFLKHCDFYGYDPREYRKALLTDYIIDDFVESSPRYELIGSELQYFYGWANPISWPEPPWTCTTMTYSLVCYDLSSPLTLSEIWRVEYDDVTEINLVFSDSEYTKKFFAFRDHRAYLHNSENGEILDSSDVMDGRILDYRAVDACNPQMEAIFVDGGSLKFYRIGISTSVESTNDNILPVAFHLGQPYPNPYNTQLSIPIDIARKTNLKVEIYNILGQQVEQIFNDRVPPGKMLLSWNSARFPSGIYFIRAQTGTQIQTAKAVLLK